MELLTQVWGYTSWRDLRFYADLREDTRSISLSQGTLVEQVVYTAEASMHSANHSQPADAATAAHLNLLLTAPTGAGKSLLFQLPAIYLGREHGLLTLVIEPLKALILDQVESLQSK